MLNGFTFMFFIFCGLFSMLEVSHMTANIFHASHAIRNFLNFAGVLLLGFV
jgi:hypothetical protein